MGAGSESWCTLRSDDIPVKSGYTLTLPKLQIPADNRHVYYIYPSEIGSYALGAALTDRQLFTLCLERGDPIGSLKFFVSTQPSGPPTQTNPAYLSERAQVSQLYLAPFNSLTLLKFLWYVSDLSQHDDHIAARHHQPKISSLHSSPLSCVFYNDSRPFGINLYNSHDGPEDVFNIKRVVPCGILPVRLKFS